MTDDPTTLEDLAELAQLVTIETKYEGRVFWHEHESFKWACKLTYRATMEVPFFMGTAHVEELQGRYPPRPGTVAYAEGIKAGTPIPPTAEDVLSSLLSDAYYALSCSGEFDLADELGEAVTRETREMWRQIVANTNALRLVLGIDFDRFMEAEQ